MNPLTGIAVVLVVLGALLLVTRRLRRREILDAEGARKLVHIGMGVICLSFPWVFGERWPVWSLAVLACVALLGLRCLPVLKREFGGVLHGVDRVSWGELYFPLGVATVYTLSRGDPVLYGVPVAILTFADAAGALIGKRWGSHKFATLEGSKSLEGSAAVALAAGVCAIVPLAVTGHTMTQALLVGCLMGLFALLLEAIAWRGLDNVFLPLAAFAQLSIYLGLPTDAIVRRLLVLILLTIVALVWRRGSLVDDSARVGGALGLYFFWVVGGWSWLIAPLVLFFSYVRLMPAVPGGVPSHNLLAVICVSSGAMVWAVANAFVPDPRWIWPYTLGIAAQQGVIALVRYSQSRPSHRRLHWAAMALVNSVLLQFAALALADQGRTLRVPDYAIGAIGIALAIATFCAWERSLQMPDDLNARWWKQGIVSFGATASGLYLLHL